MIALFITHTLADAKQLTLVKVGPTCRFSAYGGDKTFLQCKNLKGFESKCLVLSLWLGIKLLVMRRILAIVSCQCLNNKRSLDLKVFGRSLEKIYCFN